MAEEGKGLIIAGNRIYQWCDKCGTLVQINKWMFGSIHLCEGSEERITRRQ